jgi:hypothetical protein
MERGDRFQSAAVLRNLLSHQPVISFSPTEIDFSALRSRRRIAIDGDPGSGKTTLARKLECRLGAKVFSLDDYLCEDGRPYLEQIKYEELTRDITATGDVPMIVEGVCLLKALAKIDFHHDFFIFSKVFMNGRRDFDDYSNPRVRLPKSSLRREIVEYYRECRPETVSNLETSLSIDFG